MDFKKNKLKCLVLFVFLLLYSCGAREVSKNTSSQENKVVSEIKETENKKDSTTANIQKLSENTSFELEPIGDKLAHFVYIVGKDTIRVETSGKLRLNNAKNKENAQVVTTTNTEIKKEAKNEQNSKVKNKDIETKRENNSFQFILIGIIIAIVLHLAFKEIKKRLFL